MTKVAIIGAGKGGRALLEMFAGDPTESHHVMARVAHFQELERRYIPGTDERLKGSVGFSEAKAH